MLCRARSLALSLPILATISTALLVSADVDAKAKRPPVMAIVTDGIAEKLYGAPKIKGGKAALVGKTFTAICDGMLSSWKVSDLSEDGAWVGAFAGPKGKHCLLLDAPSDPAMSAKGRPAPTATQIAAAKAQGFIALTPKKGEPPQKIELSVFNDGEDFIAVAEAVRPAGPKSNCLEKTSLVIMTEQDDGTWKSTFRPQPKGKDTCGYTFFTRADVDADGRDEITLRVDKLDGYGYRVLKRTKNDYTVVAR